MLRAELSWILLILVSTIAYNKVEKQYFVTHHVYLWRLIHEAAEENACCVHIN